MIITTIKSIKFQEYFYNFIKLFGLYIIWIFAYYFASQLHIYYCVPATMVGFVMSPFMTSSQHCMALRWIIYNGGNNIINMWIIFGTWFVQFLKPIKL